LASLQLTYGNSATITVTGLGTLANGLSATSPVQDNTTDLDLDKLVEFIVTTSAGSTAAGFVEIYIKGSIDNTDFDDDQNDKWAGTVSLGTANAVTRKRIISVASCFGGSMPPYWQIRIRNATGAAFASASVQVRGVKAQTL
jgi:hypothetical protein